jgi:hypothetical protein
VEFLFLEHKHPNVYDTKERNGNIPERNGHCTLARPPWGSGLVCLII